MRCFSFQKAHSESKLLIHSSSTRNRRLQLQHLHLLLFLLDSIFLELETLAQNLRGSQRIFVNCLLSNLKSERRFPDGLKLRRLYNCLTLLDPRYGDLYFGDAAALQHALHDLHNDNIFDGEGAAGQGEQHRQPAAATPAVQPTPGDIIALRR